MSSEQLTELRIDKTTWPPGPWHDEPDRVQWQHAGYACLVLRRDRLGHWCGYVGVDNSHPLYGKDYSDADADVNVHRGLTYADKCSGAICHVPEPGMPDDVWWFGFDCAHSGDLAPGIEAITGQLAPLLPSMPESFSGMFRDTYRDLAYVKAETESLAEQLRALAVQ